ncbi:MAG TPA: hypothetical protein VMI54_18305 [Polyangiaceae bacterium]|nr:hypothetical protein [Polyangiaceae bacterium]
MKRAQAGLVALVAAGAHLACAGAVESSKFEDKARRTVPVPVCVAPLQRNTSGVSNVGPGDYWKMVLPSFDAASATVDTSAPDCAGRQAFSESDRLDAEGPRTGSVPVPPDNAVITAGPDNFRVVWLRTYKYGDGSWSGPIALTRAREGYAEVYGTGTYRGRPSSTRFALERMGSRILVTATDEGCGQVKPGQGCETDFDAYLLAGGQLSRAASFPLDRIDYRPFGGLPGVAKYRLTAAPVFQARAMRVIEQVTVEDANQGMVRKSDLERVFSLTPEGALKPNAPSLWSEIEKPANAPPPPPPPPPPPARARPSSTNR